MIFTNIKETKQEIIANKTKQTMTTIEVIREWAYENCHTYC